MKSASHMGEGLVNPQVDVLPIADMDLDKVVAASHNLGFIANCLENFESFVEVFLDLVLDSFNVSLNFGVCRLFICWTSSTHLTLCPVCLGRCKDQTSCSDHQKG